MTSHQVARFVGFHSVIIGHADIFERLMGECISHNETVTNAALCGIGDGTHFISAICNFRIEGDRKACRNRPRRGRPDKNAGAIHPTTRLGLGTTDGISNVCRRDLEVFVFDLGLSQGCLFDSAPHDRLLFTIKPSIHKQLMQLADYATLRIEIGRLILVIPIGRDTQRFELLALLINPSPRIHSA